MSYDIKCEACGHKNPLGRIYCMSCGAHLDVTEKAVDRAQQSERDKAGLAFGWLPSVITLVLLAVVVLLLIPAPARGKLGTRKDAGEMSRKLTSLQYAVLEKQAARQTLLEEEVNAYWMEKLQQAPAGQRHWLGGIIQGINVHLVERRAVLVVRTQWGPLRVSQAWTVQPKRRDGQWIYQVRGLRIGRLPMPEAVASTLAGYAPPIFKTVERERKLLDHLAALEVRSGRVEVATSRL